MVACGEGLAGVGIGTYSVVACGEVLADVVAGSATMVAGGEELVRGAKELAP